MKIQYSIFSCYCQLFRTFFKLVISFLVWWRHHDVISIVIDADFVIVVVARWLVATEWRRVLTGAERWGEGSPENKKLGHKVFCGIPEEVKYIECNRRYSKKCRKLKSNHAPIQSRSSHSWRHSLCKQHDPYSCVSGQRCHAGLSAYGTFWHLHDSTRPVSIENKVAGCHGVSLTCNQCKQHTHSDRTIFCLSLSFCLLFISDQAVPSYMFVGESWNAILWERR